MYGIAPALLHGILPDVVWKNFCKFVYGVRLLLQREITLDDLLKGQKALDEFVIEFELLYVERRTDRLHFVRPCIHALIHLGLEITRFGPSGLYSTWTMERTIGNLGQEIKQPSNPYANLSMRALHRAQVNAITAMLPGLGEYTEQSPRGSQDLGDGYWLLPARERTARVPPTQHQQAMFQYLLQHQAELRIVTMPKLIKFARWGRLQLPNGQVARSAWKETTKAVHKVRRSRCIKVCIFWDIYMK